MVVIPSIAGGHLGKWFMDDLTTTRDIRDFTPTNDSLARVRHGFVPCGTPPRPHKIIDRAARKALARDIGRQRDAHLRAGGTYKTFAFKAAE
jgi:hypothetical protein